MTTSGYIDTYYRRTMTQVDARPVLSEPLQAETCVIGGGLAGIATALGLAERGRDVVLVEAERIGWGASGRNGGFLSPGYSLGPADLVRKLGKPAALDLYELSRDAVNLIRARVKALGVNGGDLPAGIVRNSWFDDPDGVKAGIAYMNEAFDEALEYWPREKAREAYLSPRYHDAVFNPNGYQLHPLNYALATAAEAERLGAKLFESTRVTGVRQAGGQYLVTTETGEIEADNVVFCCSSLGGWLEPRLAWATLAIGTYVLLTEPLGDRLDSVIRAPYAASDNRRIENYYRVLPDTRLLWGGGMSISTAPANLADNMLGDLFHVYPQLHGLKAETAWAGTMGYARHKMPHIGKLSDGLWYCQAFGGHGLNTTTVGGEMIARAIAEDDRTYQAFEPFGLDFVGGPAGLLAAQTIYWTWKTKDRMDAG